MAWVGVAARAATMSSGIATEKRKVGQSTTEHAGLAWGQTRALLPLTVTRRILRFLFAALLTTPALPAQEISPVLTGGHFQTDPATGEAVVTENPRLVYGSAVLEADSLRFTPKTKIAIARGNARLTLGTQRLLADEIVYRLESRAISVTGMKLGDFPLYLSGNNVTGTVDEITVTDAVFTYHEPQLFGPVLKADKLVFKPKQSIRAENARVGVGSFLPFRFITYEQSLDQPILSYLDATVGYRGSLGAFATLGTRLPVASGIQAGGDLSLYSKRGFLLGPAATYRRETANGGYSGELKSGYIHDYGERLTDILRQPIPADRGYAEWTHHQRFSETVTLNGHFAYWSDSEITRDFRPQEFYPVQQPDTFLEAAHTGQNHILSVFLRAQPNSYYRVQQRLPEVRFDLLPTALPLGLYQQIQASAVALREDALFDGPTTRSDRLDAYYGLSRPINPRPWLNITPVAGARVTHYARATGGKDDYTRTLGEIGADASLRASGFYAYKNERWGIDGIRHLITPKLSYRYIPEANKGRAYIPYIDDQTFQTYLQPLGLGEQRAIDDLGATNTLRLALDNTFQTRHRNYGSRDLLRVNFAADFHPDTEPGQKDFSAIHTDLAFTPIHWLTFNLYQSVTPQDFTLRELNTGFTLRDGDVWSVYVGNHFLRRNIHEYITEGRYRFTEAWQTYARLHFDARKHRFIEQSYGVVQNLDNLWTIRYGISVYNGQRRESKFGFNIQVQLVGF
jgi:LPS-assembly protein